MKNSKDKFSFWAHPTARERYVGWSSGHEPLRVGGRSGAESDGLTATTILEWVEMKMTEWSSFF